MNTRIFTLIKENLNQAFNLPKYQQIRDSIAVDTDISKLPWTPARYRKFKDSIEETLTLDNCEFEGPLKDVIHVLSERYIKRFFGEIWKPQTDEFTYSGWQLVDTVNKLNPKSVLDVGCGYHPFKGRIQNIVGIDPYNNCADYMVDILNYKVKPGTHDVIMALGSINFNSKDEIEERFKHCVDILESNGTFILRVNPGILHKTGPYVDIFPWSFEVAVEFAERYKLSLKEFKKDTHGRLYIVYKKDLV